MAKARAYADVEHWAKTHTPRGTLFMPDPMHNYGWRQGSERPSYGSLREWLYTGWLYNSRRDVFQEGVQRFEALGLKLDDYYRMDLKKRNSAGGKLYNDVTAVYYGKDTGVFEGIYKLRDVQYFVFDKSKLTHPPVLPIAYQNSYYIVARHP